MAQNVIYVCKKEGKTTFNSRKIAICSSCALTDSAQCSLCAEGGLEISSKPSLQIALLSFEVKMGHSARSYIAKNECHEGEAFLRSWGETVCISGRVAFWRKLNTCLSTLDASHFTVFFANLGQIIFLLSDFCSASWVKHHFYLMEVAVWACLWSAETCGASQLQLLCVSVSVFLCLSTVQIQLTKP